MPKRRKPPSQTWKAFLENHVKELVSIDFFTVPTARFRAWFVLVVLAHHRRRVVHFNVTENPTAAWTAQQIVEAFPEVSPRSKSVRMRFWRGTMRSICYNLRGFGRVCEKTGPPQIPVLPKKRVRAQR